MYFRCFRHRLFRRYQAQGQDKLPFTKKFTFFCLIKSLINSNTIANRLLPLEKRGAEGVLVRTQRRKLLRNLHLLDRREVEDALVRFLQVRNICFLYVKVSRHLVYTSTRLLTNVSSTRRRRGFRA